MRAEWTDYVGQWFAVLAAHKNHPRSFKAVAQPRAIGTVSGRGPGTGCQSSWRFPWAGQSTWAGQSRPFTRFLLCPGLTPLVSGHGCVFMATKSEILND